MKTPGVYLIEKDAFPNSVVEVATAVPAFIGYTEKAENGTKSLINKPFRISSFGEYMQYYGGPPEYKFKLDLIDAKAPETPESEGTEEAETEKPAESAVVAALTVKDKKYSLEREGTVYRLFDAIRLFYQNGGGPCYIVSVGSYENEIVKGLLDGTDTKKPGGGLVTLEKEQEPTMVLIPDALSLDENSCYGVYTQMIAHCVKMQSRISILDIYNGFQDRKDPAGDTIEAFRIGVGANGLKYATAYYPWVETTIVQENEVSFTNLTDESLEVLKNLILNELAIPADATADPKKPEDKKTIQTRAFLNDLTVYTAEYVKNKLEGTGDDDDKLMPEDVNKSLVFLSSAYNKLLKDIQNRLNELPPASAMAGVYTMVDATRGVWKAPANVSLNAVVRPSVNITFEDQQDLNVSLTGKSINAIRSFIGEGVLVWGARTLDGNSGDWKYINVRRTVIMMEQSVKAAAKAYVFEPNDAGTWTTIKSMIENFLYQQWKSGALVGSKPTEAFSVHVGLGDTMSGDDILNGIMRITVLIAVSRPAEFIEITFQQQMQKS